MCCEIDALNDEMKAEGCWCQEFRWRQQICMHHWFVVKRVEPRPPLK